MVSAMFKVQKVILAINLHLKITQLNETEHLKSDVLLKLFVTVWNQRYLCKRKRKWFTFMHKNYN